MSGFCGWTGLAASREEMRRWADRASASLSGDSASRAEAVFAREGAIAAVPPRARAVADGGVVAFVQGAPAWDEPGLAAVAARDGAARALLEGWRRKGVALLDVLGGHFAAALLDEERGEALLATDRVGSEPLVFGQADGGLLFASRGECLQAHPKGAAPVDDQAVYDYLYHSVVPAPRTIRRGRQRLLPGHCVRFAGGRATVEAYARTEYRDDDTVPLEDLAREFRERVRQAVARHGGGDGVGAFLSGGTDSSTVSGMLGEVTGRPARTYSIGFHAQGYDEMEYARIAARHFRTEHHEHYMTPEEVLEAIPRIARIYSDPFGNESAVAAYACARVARADGVERMLAGDGGDEIFAGNARYADLRLFRPWQALPLPLRRHVLEPVFRRLPKFRGYVRLANTPMPDRMEDYNYLHRFGAERVLEPAFLRRVDTGEPLADLRRIWAEARTSSDLNRMLAIDMKLTIADSDLPKVSRMCELAGVEARYPLLDDALVDLAARVPVRWKLKGSKLRWFFKHALRDFLPPEVLTKKKHGFGLPFGVWMASHPGLQELARESLSGLKRRGIVRPDFIDEILRLHATEHAKYYGVMVWRLLMLEQWFRAHEDGAPCAA
jgi:asparagine synthase (glutamine-hydrolysing)